MRSRHVGYPLRLLSNPLEVIEPTSRVKTLGWTPLSLRDSSLKLISSRDTFGAVDS